jgi:hypothetical protein
MGRGLLTKAICGHWRLSTILYELENTPGFQGKNVAHGNQNTDIDLPAELTSRQLPCFDRNVHSLPQGMSEYD